MRRARLRTGGWESERVPTPVRVRGRGRVAWAWPGFAVAGARVEGCIIS